LQEKKIHLIFSNIISRAWKTGALMSLNRLDLIGDYSRCARLLKKKSIGSGVRTY